MISTMQFGAALALVQSGHRISRAGWNGKGQFVVFVPPAVIPAEKVSDHMRRFVPSGDVKVGGYLVLKNAQDVWQQGWNPSTGDVLANDWIDLDDGEGPLP